MRLSRLSCLLPAALIAAALAACGGAQTPPGSSAATAPSSTSPGAPLPPPASAPAPAGAPGGNGAATLGDDSFKGPMKNIAATSMVADLQAIGLDPAALPSLDQLPPDKLRKVMKTFTKALGARCSDCHVDGDFDAPTPRKAIAAGMWDHFVREVSFKDGTPVYCDSCHQGTLTPLLDRHDKKALSEWMETNYEKGLKRRDGKENRCESCHGDPFQSRFLKTWASAPPK